MSQKLTFNDWSNIAKERGHVLLSVSNPNNIRKGTLTICCDKDHTFTITANSYASVRPSRLTNTKSGCPTCKALNTSLLWKGRSRGGTPSPIANTTNTTNDDPGRIKEFRKNVNHKHPQETPLPSSKLPSFSHIKDRPDLIAWLCQTPNLYNNYILDHLQSPRTVVGSTQKHHIIPRHAGGPDESWNIIQLSLEAHKEAHQIRAKMYGDSGDVATLQLMNFGTEKAEDYFRTVLTLSHESQKRNKKGFFSSEQQSLSGKKGGSIQTQDKIEKYKEKMSPEVKQCLEQGTTWYNLKTQQSFKVAPNEVQLLTEFKEIFLKSFGDVTTPEAEKLKNAKNTTFTSSLARVLKRERQKLYGIELLE